MSRRKKIYNASTIDVEWLKYRCQQSINSFEEEGGEVVKTPTGTYIYKDNGANILAVAHRDVVARLADSRIFDLKNNLIYAPQLDDRLGCHLILDILPRLDLKYDILLTEGEESGNSTAKHFKAPEGKKYNWMFELDRMGLETVMYRYETQEMKKLLNEFNLRVGRGSFTDICDLEDLGCIGINFACAYYGQHSEGSYVNVEQLEELLIPNIVNFIKVNQDKHFPHEKKVYETHTTVYHYPSGGYGGYWQDTKNNNHKDRNPSRWERFEWNQEKQKFFCKYCGRGYKECTDITCKNEKFTACQICNIAGCEGYEKCGCCGFYYHRDKLVANTGFCFECLNSIFGIDHIILGYAYSITPAVMENAFKIINEKIGVAHEETKVF